jgi:hypothetical protein
VPGEIAPSASVIHALGLSWTQFFCHLSEMLGEAAMVNETDLFYLVVLILLTLIILLVLSATGPRRDGRSRR